MAASTTPVADRATDLEQRLERGEIIHYPVCPFPLPEGDDRQFLLQQRLASRAHKNISYDPRTGKASGFAYQSLDHALLLRRIFADFSRHVTTWLAQMLPRYASGWRLDQVSFRPEEEATRKLRLKARNDLLHVDAFPSRPTNGWRILRVFANVNLTEPRVWVTSDPFAKLFARFAGQVSLPGNSRFEWLGEVRAGVLRLCRPRRPQRSAYDAFMLRFHDFLKANDEFQERGPKRYWSFAPGSAWLCLTDTASHAALRGRFALEHSYFLSPASLVLPDESPAAILERACGRPVLRSAA
jgi:hypothetical protein